MERNINRIKTALVDNGKTSKWFAEEISKTPCIVSKWCTNSSQPDFSTLKKDGELLDVDEQDLIRVPEHNPFKD